MKNKIFISISNVFEMKKYYIIVVTLGFGSTAIVKFTAQIKMNIIRQNDIVTNLKALDA